MPGIKRTHDSNAGVSKRPKRRLPYRRRRTGKARPMRSLKTNYRSQNVYRFCRETLPEATTFSIIPTAAGTATPAMGYLTFENLQFGQLAKPAEFEGLFARYKVDKIQTTLIPMFDNMPANPNVASSVNLEITRVNSKWISGAFPIQTISSLKQMEALAQFQAKSKSLYASRRPLVITTMNPGVAEKTVIDSTGTEIQTRGPMPWLPLAQHTVPLKHNSVLFASRVDGTDMDVSWKYRVTHKIWFRCAQVG